MSEDFQEQFLDVLKEDLKGYMNGLDESDYGFCNILSNRMITNAVILRSKSYALLGAILKEITYEFRFYKDDDKLKKGIRKLKKILTNYSLEKTGFNSKQLIEDYYEYYQEFRELIKSDLEEYEENTSFSMVAIKFCLEFYIKELNYNDIPINLDVLVFGVLNEINRVIKSHGCTAEQLMLKILLNSFGRMYEYYRFFLDAETKKERWLQSYNNLKEKVINNLKKIFEDQPYIESSIDLIFEICEEWRYMFIRMLEIPKTTVLERQVTVPKKVKEDLNGIVSDLISSKLEDKKND